MNWYKIAQLERTKGKVSPIPSWQKEYKPIEEKEKEVYPGVYKQPVGNWYTDIGHDVISHDVTLYFIDTQYQIHTLEADEENFPDGEYVKEILHSNWSEFNKYIDKEAVAVSGRNQKKNNISVTSAAIHRIVSEERIYQMIKETFGSDTKIQLYEEL